MIRAALVRFFDRGRRRFLRGIARADQIDRLARADQIDRLHDNLYDQIAGLMQIQSALTGGPVLKPLRRWALSPDAAAVILADLQERARPSIVEFGCGQSTVILASWVRHHGGRVTTYEHDPYYAEAIRNQLNACGLSSYVDLRVVPLVDQEPADGLSPSKSYDLPSDRDAFDVALVDGPPNWAGEAGRYYPLKWSVDRLNPGGAAYLDDAARPAEQRCIAAMKTRTPGIVATELCAEKGLMKLTQPDTKA